MAYLTDLENIEEGEYIKFYGREKVGKLIRFLDFTKSTGSTLIEVEFEDGEIILTPEKEVEKVYRKDEYPEYYI